MRDNYTHITVVLDKSSSMTTVQDATIDGFNKFFDEQKTVPGHATCTLVQFSDSPDVTFSGVDINYVSNLNRDAYRPSGSTALFDGIRKAVETTGQYLGSIPEPDRPSKVIVLIMTDGEENVSRYTTAAQVAEMIKHQSEKYSWQFVFIGANQDAILTAASMGISAGNALNYAANAAGTAQAIASTNNSLRTYRTKGLSPQGFYGSP